MHIGLKNFVNQILSLDMLRRKLSDILRFPSNAELKKYTSEEHLHDIQYYSKQERLSRVDIDGINDNMQRFKILDDILHIYIQNFGLEQIDRFISKTILLQQLNEKLNTLSIRVSDWLRTIKDSSIVYLKRLSWTNDDNIATGWISGIDVNHRENYLSLTRSMCQRIPLDRHRPNGKTKISYTPWGNDSKITLATGSSLANILNQNMDTFFSGTIVTKQDTGRIMIYLDLDGYFRFNCIDVDLIVPANTRVYSDSMNNMIARSDEHGCYHSLNFPHKSLNNISIEIETPYHSTNEDNLNVFNFGIRSISISNSSFSNKGGMSITPIVLIEDTYADTIAVESTEYGTGSIKYTVTGIQSTNNTGITIGGSFDKEITRGTSNSIDNTIKRSPVTLNLLDKVTHEFDPVYGRDIYSFDIDTFAGDNVDNVIPNSIRLVPHLDTCVVQTYKNMEDIDYYPSLEEWNNESLYDTKMQYAKSLQDISYIFDIGRFISVLPSGTVSGDESRHTRIDMFIKSPSIDINTIFNVYHIEGVLASYYLDNELIGTSSGKADIHKTILDCPINLKANQWHKITICLYVSYILRNDDGTGIVQDLFGKESLGAMGLSNFIMHDSRIAVSSLQAGEIPYAIISDLPYIKDYRYSIADDKLYTTANIQHGNTNITWKEWATSPASSMIKIIFFDIDMSTSNNSVTPKLKDTIILLGESIGLDPLG